MSGVQSSQTCYNRELLLRYRLEVSIKKIFNIFFSKIQIFAAKLEALI